MNYEQLQQELRNLRVTPPDVLRASLYLDYLQMAGDFFHRTMADPVQGGLFPNDYDFVYKAVQSPNLLNELAKVMDLFVGSAVSVTIKNACADPEHGSWTYKDYFEKCILDIDDNKYKTNVTTFRRTYPIVDYALERLFINFTHNIKEACRRIINDIEVLTEFYKFLYPGLDFVSLDTIESTGSDFHKSGKQVLILTFSVIHVPGRLRDLKVVYKPSDVEVDCLIAGNSAAIRSVTRKFKCDEIMHNSVFEIYNNKIGECRGIDPSFAAECLDTYLILPRNYGSGLVEEGGRLPVETSYGYIQYLNHELSYPIETTSAPSHSSKSDYLIFENEDGIVEQFYQKEGGFAALACSLSFVDCHLENIRVKDRIPYPIDLEVCLTRAVKEIRETVLTGSIGGITAYEHFERFESWSLEDRGDKPRLSLDGKEKYFQNRLWRWKPGGQKQLIPVDSKRLMQGYQYGMEVLRACINDDAFKKWIDRLAKVVVRYVPIPTGDFKTMLFGIYLEVNEKDLREWIGRDLRRKYNDRHASFNASQNPDFIVLTPDQAGEDFLNLDIPAFYRRIDESDLINSRGHKVPLPEDVKAAVKRNTFFAEKPFNKNVYVGQLQILAHPERGEFEKRRSQIEKTIRDDLSPPLYEEIVPLDTPT